MTSRFLFFSGIVFGATSFPLFFGCIIRYFLRGMDVLRPTEWEREFPLDYAWRQYRGFPEAKLAVVALVMGGIGSLLIFVSTAIE